MPHAFPEQTVTTAYEVVMNARVSTPSDFKTLYRGARMLANYFFESYYSFEDCLRTGLYAPYPHEKTQNNISGSNCTTIIPELYLMCEAVELKPQIVQFINFRDIQDAEDKDDPLSPSHFSIIVDVGRKHRYLLDPFYKTFGPILADDNKVMKVGKRGSRPARKREYETKLEYSVAEFAAMMTRLKDPGESLGMLVAGQKIYQAKGVGGFNCQLMVYYDDEQNTVSTRLWIPQIGISNKAIYCKMGLSRSGKTRETTLELSLAKDYSWTALVKPKKVATVDFSTIYQLRKILRNLVIEEGEEKNKRSGYGNRRFRIYDRLGPTLQNKSAERVELFEIVNRLHQGLTMAEQDSIRPVVYARTLYENFRPGKEFISTEQRHDLRLFSLRSKELKFQEELNPIDRLLWMHGWKWDDFEKREMRKLERQRKKLEDQNGKVVKEINELNNLRRYHRKSYHRTMDKVLFAKALEDLPVEDLERSVLEQGLDWRMGYLGMIVDFIPFIVAGKKDLTLKRFMTPLREKVKARKSKSKLVTAIDSTVQTPLAIEADQLQGNILQVYERLW